MALHVKKTEMNGDTSRWMRRAVAKDESKTVRRRIDIAEIASSVDYYDGEDFEVTFVVDTN